MPLLSPITQDVPYALCTLDDVKARLSASSGTWADARIAALIPAVGKTFITRYGREFTPVVTATRAFAVRGRYVDLVRSDLRSATSVTLDGQPVEGYELLPHGGDPLTGTYVSLLLPSAPVVPNAIAVTGVWGCWASVDEVPADVRAAAVETVLAWLDRSVGAVTGIQPGEARQPWESAPLTWDVPLSAHRKMLAYSRDLGAF